MLSQLIAPWDGYVAYAERCNIIVSNRTSVLQKLCLNKGYRDVLNFIFDNNLYPIDLKDEDSGRTAVHYAAELCDSELLECLKKRNCNVNLKDKDGLSPLFICINNRRLEMLEIATNKPARQSSEMEGFPARFAVDPSENSYSSTALVEKNGENCWLEVEVGVYEVYSVILYNRTDEYKDRLRDIVISFYLSDLGEVFTSEILNNKEDRNSVPVIEYLLPSPVRCERVRITRIKDSTVNQDSSDPDGASVLSLSSISVKGSKLRDQDCNLMQFLESLIIKDCDREIKDKVFSFYWLFSYLPTH